MKKEKHTSTKFKVLVGISIGTVALSAAALATTLVYNNQLQAKMAEEERIRKWYQDEYWARVAEWQQKLDKWEKIIEEEEKSEEKALKYEAMAKIAEAATLAIARQPEAEGKIRAVSLAAMDVLIKNNPNGTKSIAIGDISNATIRGVGQNPEYEKFFEEAYGKFTTAIVKSSTSNIQAQSLGWQGTANALAIAFQPDAYSESLEKLNDEYISKTLAANDIIATLYGYCVGISNYTTFDDVDEESSTDKYIGLYFSIMKQPEATQKFINSLDDAVYSYINKINTQDKAVSVGKIGGTMCRAIAFQPEAEGKIRGAAKDLIEIVVNQ